MNDDLKQYLDEHFAALATKEDLAETHRMIAAGLVERTDECMMLERHLAYIEELHNLHIQRIIW